MKPELRKAVRADAKEIARLEDEIFSDAWSLFDIEAAIDDGGGVCYVAEAEGEIISYVIGRKIEPEAEIYRVATAKAYRRCGYSKLLIDFLFCAEGGVEKIFLEVRESNGAARGLYSSLGFKEISVRKNYYKSPCENAVIMLKDKKNEDTCI